MKKLFITMLFVLTASISFAQCSYTYNSYFTGKTRVIISESNGTYTKTTWDENGDMIGSQTVSANYAAQACSQKVGLYAMKRSETSDIPEGVTMESLYNYYGSGWCQQTDAYATTTYFYNTETGEGSRVVVRKSDNKIIDYKRMSASLAQAVCTYLAPAN